MCSEGVSVVDSGVVVKTEHHGGTGVDHRGKKILGLGNPEFPFQVDGYFDEVTSEALRLFILEGKTCIVAGIEEGDVGCETAFLELVLEHEATAEAASVAA